jgi:hypothetical protein
VQVRTSFVDFAALGFAMLPNWSPRSWHEHPRFWDCRRGAGPELCIVLAGKCDAELGRQQRTKRQAPLPRQSPTWHDANGKHDDQRLDKSTASRERAGRKGSRCVPTVIGWPGQGQSICWHQLGYSLGRNSLPDGFAKLQKGGRLDLADALAAHAEFISKVSQCSRHFGKTA